MGLILRKNKIERPTNCPLTDVVDLLSKAWALAIIWNLSILPRRFGELRHDLPTISARVLSIRLHELEARGLVVRQPMQSPPPSSQYVLSALSQDFLPILNDLTKIGHRLTNMTPEYNEFS
ncbi:helix-turn-helix domain-containing protein [Pseudomonas sp. L13]|uniref:winged helix-turn-helix transcriptional regulator n=1 Tax=Pseudomonas sp. L13 TaxID=343985 RepID=UPI00137A2265|nr:helix-turn-helix domain-containing protein [Pseudomonas sp. L13]NCE89687.1 transcriptional regulator [Pseudomonas sp. L13]